jgi:hypothetical protein
MTSGGKTRFRIDALLKASWSAYEHASTFGWLVQPSIPVLYFGDLDRYLE